MRKSCRTSSSRSSATTKAAWSSALLHAAARLDWPSHKLHIQMLDDSTDDTLAVARITVADLQATGVDVVLLHRERRDD